MGLKEKLNLHSKWYQRAVKLVWLLGFAGFIKSVREVPTLLLRRLAFGNGLCRVGMFKATRANVKAAEVSRDRTAMAKV